jgi:hypothetical protein
VRCAIYMSICNGQTCNAQIGKGQWTVLSNYLEIEKHDYNVFIDFGTFDEKGIYFPRGQIFKLSCGENEIWEMTSCPVEVIIASMPSRCRLLDCVSCNDLSMYDLFFFEGTYDDPNPKYVMTASEHKTPRKQQGDSQVQIVIVLIE